MFIVIEKHGGWEYASVVYNEDGSTRVFDTLEEAQAEADDCQDGIVVGDEIFENVGGSLIQELEKVKQLLEDTSEVTSETVEAKLIIESLLDQLQIQ